MLSKRAQMFLDSYPREENVCTPAEVEAAFLDKGIPFTDALRDFHQHMAGCIDQWRGERIVYGLVHRTEDPESLEGNAWQDQKDDSHQGEMTIWFIRRALNSYLMIDSEGVLYGDQGASAESWHMELERAAFLEEQSQKPDVRSMPLRIYNSSHQLKALESRLTSYFQKDLSDRFARVYASETWSLPIFHDWNLLLCGPLPEHLFDEVHLQLSPRSITPRELAILQVVQKCSPYGKRPHYTDASMRAFLQLSGPITESMEYSLCNSGDEDEEVKRLYLDFQELVYRQLLIGQGNWPMLAGPRYTACGLSAEGQKLLEAIAAGQ